MIYLRGGTNKSFDFIAEFLWQELRISTDEQWIPLINVVLKMDRKSSGPYNHMHYIIVACILIILEGHICDRGVPKMCQKVNIELF